MKKNIITRFLLIGILALTLGSCDNNEDPSSVITSFATIPITTNTTQVVASESDEERTHTLDFTLDENQITDLVVEIGIGASSTATEGLDFELSTHQVDLLAFEGQDGFSIDITILEDFEVEGKDETLYLTFTSTTPSGIDQSEILVATIKDSGLDPQPGETVEFTLRWEFTDPEMAEVDICELGVDMDLTLQTQGTAEYDDDLMGFAAASLACPEHGTLTVDDMVEGEVYDVWVLTYGGFDFGEYSDMTVYIDYARENSDFNGTITIEGEFDSTMPANGGPMFTIERNGNVLTLKNGNDEVLGEGRMDEGTERRLQQVKKRTM